MMPTDAWVQYGCFGLLAMLVIWSLMKGIPNALEIHRQTMQNLTATFEKESESCRAERLTEGERNRQSRDRANDVLAQAIGQLRDATNDIRRLKDDTGPHTPLPG